MHPHSPDLIRGADPALLQPAEELALVDTARGVIPHGINIVLTEAALADNWLRHWHTAGRTAVVSLHQTQDLVGVDLAAYLAYELVLNGLSNASPRYDLLTLAHDGTSGCLYDFCGDKRDMEVKLQTMHLCTSVRRNPRPSRYPRSAGACRHRCHSGTRATGGTGSGARSGPDPRDATNIARHAATPQS